MRLLSLVVGLGVVVAATGAANAQHAAQPEKPVREGAVFGLGLGIGGMHLDNEFSETNDFSAVFLNLMAGGMVTPQLAVLAEGSLSSAEVDVDLPPEPLGNRMARFTLAVLARYWVTPKLWLQGGLGTSSLTYADDGDELDSVEGVSLCLGAGYQLFGKMGRYGIDIQAAMNSARYERDIAFEDGRDRSRGLSIGFGLYWY